MDERDFEAELASVLDNRAGSSALESAASAGVDDRELLAALEAIDVAWEAQLHAPALADDPTAVMLGLVPDPETVFDSKAAIAERKRSGRTVTELAAQLTARGWNVTAQDVFAWEHNSPSMAPALVRAIAEEIGTSQDALLRRVGTDPNRERLRAIFAMPDFQQLATRWARTQGTTLSAALSALEARTIAAVHRGTAPEPDVVLQSLETLLEALEGRDDLPQP